MERAGPGFSIGLILNKKPDLVNIYLYFSILTFYFFNAFISDFLFYLLIFTVSFKYYF
jgi:hypothetical protein